MQNLINLFYYTNHSIINLIFTPFYIVIVVFLYMLMYRNTTNFFEYGLYTIYYSIIGVLISYLGVLLEIGISFNKYFLLIIPITLMISTVKQRYVCLAYTGAILGIIGVVIPKIGIDIKEIIGVVALLHLLESILIFSTFDYQPRREIIYENNKLKLGFILEKTWLVPFVIIIGRGELLPLSVLVGFSAKSNRDDKEKKALISAVQLLIYSIVLIFIYVFAKKIPSIAWVGLIVMPVLHEMLIIYKDK